ncbi:MAG: hypothetical protein ACREX3_00105 [Gammaproteobacteria bacterium]
MSALIVGVLAVVVTAGLTLPLGWWLGNRHPAAELRWHKDFYARSKAIIDEHDRQHEAVVGRVVQASLNAIRAQRGR